MKAKLEQGIRNVLGFSLGAHIPTEVSFPYIIANAFKNICALSLGTNVFIDATINMKDASEEKPEEKKPEEKKPEEKKPEEKKTEEKKPEEKKTEEKKT
jgi:outer membrane biosynthesis protein TonB